MLCINGNNLVSRCPFPTDNDNLVSVPKEKNAKLETQTEQIRIQQTQIDLQAEQIKQQQLQITALKEIVCSTNPTAKICLK